MLAKFDLQSAYWVVLVHSQDQNLLECSWEDQIYLDRALPFGLHSAPKLFFAVAAANTLAWAMLSSGVQYLFHYLDGFIILGSPNSTQCHKALHKPLQVCSS